MKDTVDPSAFATLDELTAGLPHILAAPKDAGAIHAICRRATFGARDFPDRLEVTPEDGVIGDRWKAHAWLKRPDGSPDPRIQVCLLPSRVHDLVCARPGMPHPGDTIIADLDMSAANLPTGTRLRVGSAVLEVSDVFNDACVKWRARHGEASHRWINDPRHVPLRLRGVLCLVVKAGSFTARDQVIPIREAAT